MSQDKPHYEKVDGADLLIAIVAASYNQVLVDALVKRATQGLKAGGKTQHPLKPLRPGRFLPDAKVFFPQGDAIGMVARVEREQAGQGGVGIQIPLAQGLG